MQKISFQNYWLSHLLRMQQLEDLKLPWYFFQNWKPNNLILFSQNEGTAAFATLIFTLLFPERMLGECETDFKFLLAKRSSNWALGNLKFFPLEVLTVVWPFLYWALRTSCYSLVTHNKLVFSTSPDFLREEKWLHFKTSQNIYHWSFVLTTWASNFRFLNSIGIEGESINTFCKRISESGRLFSCSEQ